LPVFTIRFGFRSLVKINSTAIPSGDLVGALKKLPALAAIRKAAKGERLEIPAVQYHAGKRIQVQASEEDKQVPLELDGEVWGYLPVIMGCTKGPRLSAFLKPQS